MSYSFSRDIARRSGSNFYYSFFFLPRKKRNALLSIYAFSRLIDDAVDQATDESVARQQIEDWKEKLGYCYNGGDKSHPLVAELTETVQQFQIPKKFFSDLLVGVEMDISKKRYQTFSELEKYCYHVAGTIGLLCNHLFGLKGEKGEKYAILLGTAFQLTNIIRDVGVDAKMGRIYLPQDEIERFGCSESEILSASPSPSFYDLMRFQASRVEDYFQRAFQSVPWKERKKIIPAEMMTGVYYGILKKIRRENFPVLEKKVTLSRPRKLGVMLKSLLRSQI